jgi:hypothetical protein
LIILSRIRNRFAHVIEAKDFSGERINAWLKNMGVYQLIPGVVTQFKERAIVDPTRNNKAAAFTAERLLDGDNISVFRFCIDLMADHLEKCGSNMAKNLASLPGNWLVLPVDSNPEADG